MPASHKRRQGWYDRVGKSSGLLRVADSHFMLRNVARASVGEAESELPTGSDFPWLLLRQDTEA